METPSFEPDIAAIHASWHNAANVPLARALHRILWPGSAYDRFTAHRWVLKLRQAQPTNGEEVAVALCNFPSMHADARMKYQTSPQYQAQHDAAYAAYRAAHA